MKEWRSINYISMKADIMLLLSEAINMGKTPQPAVKTKRNWQMDIL